MDSKLDSLLKRIETFDKKVPCALMPRSTAELLSFLVVSSKAKNILELGTSIGYSAIWMAEASKKVSGHVYTIEKSTDRTKLARVNFKDSGLRNITLLEGEILDYLSGWKRGELDLVLIDAMKKEYLEYYKLVLPLLKIM